MNIPDSFQLKIHTESFVSEVNDTIFGVLAGKVEGPFIHSFSDREARFVHQKMNLYLSTDTCVFELSLPPEYAEQIMKNTFSVDEAFGDFCRNNWTHVYQLFPVEGLRRTDLYRSEEKEVEFQGKRWKIKFWFCGPKVDCGIHNEHNFIEWHVGIAGDGRMEKFTDKDENTLIESWRMSPGQSHPIFAYPNKKDPSKNPVYPYHRWVGGNTGDIWMVVEEYF